jgi:hypothetical protein
MEKGEEKKRKKGEKKLKLSHYTPQRSLGIDKV